jgi:hypothetical protein
MTRRDGALVFAALLLTYVQFFQAATWGTAVRFDLARALVEQRSLRIDDYRANTGDGAFFAGHYYSEKGPLPSFVAAPGVALARAWHARTGWPAAEPMRLAVAAGLGTILASGLPTALAGALLLRTLAQRGAPPDAAALSTAFVFLGTLLFPYATLLHGHAIDAATLLLFFHAAFPAEGAPTFRGSLLGGAAASAGLATDAQTGPAFAILGVVSLLRHRDVAARHALAMAAGALPGLAALGLYHHAAFASPFSFGYEHVALPAFQEVGRGVFGIGAPDPRVAVELLFGPYRGLFFACPVLIAAVAGLVELARSPGRRAEAAAVALVLAYHVVTMAGRAMWNGGWAIGPRHLIPVIPLLALGLPAALARRPRATCALGALSVLFMLAATSVQPEVPEDVANPLFDHVLPRFVRGELSVGEQSFLERYPARAVPDVPDRWDAFLLGELAGLPGALALVPVLLPWLLFVRRADRK